MAAITLIAGMSVLHACSSVSFSSWKFIELTDRFLHLFMGSPLRDFSSFCDDTIQHYKQLKNSEKQCEY